MRAGIKAAMTTTIQGVPGRHPLRLFYIEQKVDLEVREYSPWIRGEIPYKHAMFFTPVALMVALLAAQIMIWLKSKDILTCGRALDSAT